MGLIFIFHMIFLEKATVYYLQFFHFEEFSQEKKKSMWRRSPSFILDERRSSNSPPMADTTRGPFQNPDSISAYYQTRAAHHGVITSDWLAQAQAAVGGVSGDAQHDLSVTDLGNEKSFNVIEEFNNWRKQPDLAEAVAAIRALAAVIRASEASTMMELEIELKKASDTLKVRIHFSLSVHSSILWALLI